jgi:hypothetical protein
MRTASAHYPLFAHLFIGRFQNSETVATAR